MVLFPEPDGGGSNLASSQVRHYFRLYQYECRTYKLTTYIFITLQTQTTRTQRTLARDSPLGVRSCYRTPDAMGIHQALRGPRGALRFGPNQIADVTILDAREASHICLRFPSGMGSPFGGKYSSPRRETKRYCLLAL